MPTIGPSDLDVFPLCLGGNVFGWTADEAASVAVLDAYAAAGGNFVDTANSYSAWVDGHSGGESESIIGAWMADRGNRDGIVVATKVGGQMPGEHGLTPDIVQRACDNSLRRLRTDRIDLYYAHFDDPETPLEETFGAFDALVRAGKVRYVGISNYSAERAREVLAVVEREGYAPVVAIQPQYNLLERDYERELRPIAEEHDLGCVPYYGVARGFLTGKYRPGGPGVDSPRAAGAAEYLSDPRALRVLETLDGIAAAHDVPPAAVALAWVVAQPTVVSTIASARTADQLAELLPMARLQLTEDELQRLDAAGAPAPPARR
jgi:aryl-alcohol dehydrogenase-like predicted oxidoreductase